MPHLNVHTSLRWVCLFMCCSLFKKAGAKTSVTVSDTIDLVQAKGLESNSKSKNICMGSYMMALRTKQPQLGTESGSISSVVCVTVIGWAVHAQLCTHPERFLAHKLNNIINSCCTVTGSLNGHRVVQSGTNFLYNS